MVFVYLLSAFLCSWIGTFIMRRYALQKLVLDIPNERSSHVVPTPRGGGVAIVCSFLLLTVVVVATSHTLFVSALAVSLAGAGVALVGFLDDHGHIQARWRLLAHFSGAVWILFCVGGVPPIPILGIEVDLSWVGWIFGAFYIVWMLNLYNFMDGIDGLASIEAICVALGGACLYALLGEFQMALLPLLLTFSVLGFLIWNFPPAKIFMGDAGSGFLGIVLAAMSLQAAATAGQLWWSWLILLGVFIVDATWTLLRRLLRGEKVYEGHRMHAYQYASRRYGRHTPVTMGVLLINIFWLFPLAAIVALGWLDGLLGLVIAYAPLLWAALKFKAGMPEVRS